MKYKLCTQAKHKKEFIHCLLLAGRCLTAAWKAEFQQTRLLLGKASTSVAWTFICWAQSHMALAYPFDWFGSAVLAVSPPCFLPVPRLLTDTRVGKSLDAVEAEMPNTKTILARNSKHSTVQTAVEKTDSIKGRPGTTYS